MNTHQRGSITLLANIDVEDLSRGIDFYTRALGLRVGRRLGSSVVELLGASCDLYLIEQPAGSAASHSCSQPRDYRRHWTPVHLDFVVPDLDTALSQALAAGAQLDGAVRNDTWGRIATLVDPFGNGFCLLQFLGRGYDEISA